MTEAKKYFKAKLKDSARVILYLCVIAMVLTLIIGTEPVRHQEYPMYDEFGNDAGYYDSYESMLYLPVTILCVTAAITPIWMFSTFMKRRSLDCYYSLPISRKALGIIHYLVGLITVAITFTVSYLINFLSMLVIGGDNFAYTPLIAHYFICLTLGAVIYTVFVFAFCEGTTNSDGVIFMLLYTLALALLVLAFYAIAQKIGIYDEGVSYVYSSSNAGYAIIFGPVKALTAVYRALVEKDSVWLESAVCDEYVRGAILWGCVWLALAIAAFAGFILRFGKRRTEATEEICSSPFGYKVLIPYFAVCAMCAFIDSGIASWVVMEVLAVVGYTIYRRGFRYKRSDIAVLIALLLFIPLCI